MAEKYDCTNIPISLSGITRIKYTDGTVDEKLNKHWDDTTYVTPNEEPKEVRKYSLEYPAMWIEQEPHPYIELTENNVVVEYGKTITPESYIKSGFEEVSKMYSVNEGEPTDDIGTIKVTGDTNVDVIVKDYEGKYAYSQRLCIYCKGEEPKDYGEKGSRIDMETSYSIRYQYRLIYGIKYSPTGGKVYSSSSSFTIPYKTNDHILAIEWSGVTTTVSDSYYNGFLENTQTTTSLTTDVIQNVVKPNTGKTNKQISGEIKWKNLVQKWGPVTVERNDGWQIESEKYFISGITHNGESIWNTLNKTDNSITLVVNNDVVHESVVANIYSYVTKWRYKNDDGTTKEYEFLKEHVNELVCDIDAPTANASTTRTKKYSNFFHITGNELLDNITLSDNDWITGFTLVMEQQTCGDYFDYFELKLDEEYPLAPEYGLKTFKGGFNTNISSLKYENIQLTATILDETGVTEQYNVESSDLSKFNASLSSVDSYGDFTFGVTKLQDKFVGMYSPRYVITFKAYVEHNSKKYESEKTVIAKFFKGDPVSVRKTIIKDINDVGIATEYIENTGTDEYYYGYQGVATHELSWNNWVIKTESEKVDLTYRIPAIPETEESTEVTIIDDKLEWKGYTLKDENTSKITVIQRPAGYFLKINPETDVIGLGVNLNPQYNFDAETYPISYVVTSSDDISSLSYTITHNVDSSGMLQLTVDDPEGKAEWIGKIHSFSVYATASLDKTVLKSQTYTIQFKLGYESYIYRSFKIIKAGDITYGNDNLNKYDDIEKRLYVDNNISEITYDIYVDYIDKDGNKTLKSNLNNTVPIPINKTNSIQSNEVVLTYKENGETVLTKTVIIWSRSGKNTYFSLKNYESVEYNLESQYHNYDSYQFGTVSIADLPKIFEYETNVKYGSEYTLESHIYEENGKNIFKHNNEYCDQCVITYEEENPILKFLPDDYTLEGEDFEEGQIYPIYIDVCSNKKINKKDAFHVSIEFKLQT